MAKRPAPNLKLSDTQLVLLNAAGQRDDDALLPPPKTLKAKGAALAKAVAALSGRGLIEERPVAADAPEWRRDDDDRPTGLFLTDAGRSMLEPEPSEHLAAEPPKASMRRTAATKTKERSIATADRKGTAKPPATKRSDSKQDVVLQMLRRKGSVSVADIAAETGWQPHTVRGFLSAVVRKKLGLRLVSEKDADGTRRYHIAVAKRDARAAAAAR